MHVLLPASASQNFLVLTKGLHVKYKNGKIYSYSILNIFGFILVVVITHLFLREGLVRGQQMVLLQQEDARPDHRQRVLEAYG